MTRGGAPPRPSRRPRRTGRPAPPNARSGGRRAMAARPAAGWPAMWRWRAWGHSTGPAWRAGRASADPELQFLGRGQAHVDDLDPGPERPPGQRMVAIDRDRVRVDRRHHHVEGDRKSVV